MVKYFGYEHSGVASYGVGPDGIYRRSFMRYCSRNGTREERGPDRLLLALSAEESARVLAACEELDHASPVTAEHPAIESLTDAGWEFVGNDYVPPVEAAKAHDHNARLDEEYYRRDAARVAAGLPSFVPCRAEPTHA